MVDRKEYSSSLKKPTRTGRFVLLSETYVDRNSVIAFERHGFSFTKIHLVGGYSFVVEIPAAKVHELLEKES